jgi:hypothetical protein
MVIIIYTIKIERTEIGRINFIDRCFTDTEDVYIDLNREAPNRRGF